MNIRTGIDMGPITTQRSSNIPLGRAGESVFSADSGGWGYAGHALGKKEFATGQPPKPAVYESRVGRTDAHSGSDCMLGVQGIPGVDFGQG